MRAHFRDVGVTGGFDHRHDLCLDVRPTVGLAGEFVSCDHHCADHGDPGLGAPTVHRLTLAPARELGLPVNQQGPVARSTYNADPPLSGLTMLACALQTANPLALRRRL
jgi:hypothetical protein